MAGSGIMVWRRMEVQASPLPRTDLGPTLPQLRPFKAVRAIAKEHGLSGKDLADLMDREFAVPELDGLSLQQASHLIDLLKTNGKE